MAIGTTQYTIGAGSSTQIATPPLASRGSIILKARTANAGVIYIGATSGVTTGTGFAIESGQSVSVDFSLDETMTIWAIASQAGQLLDALEAS